MRGGDHNLIFLHGFGSFAFSSYPALHLCSFIVYSTSHQGHSFAYATCVGGNGEFATAVRDECGISNEGGGGLRRSDEMFRKTRDLHFGEPRNLLGGDGRSRVFQHSLEVFVMYLVLDFK